MPHVALKYVEMNRLTREFHASLNFDNLGVLLRSVGVRLEDITTAGGGLYGTIRTVLDDAQDRNWLTELLKYIVANPGQYGPSLARASQDALDILAQRRAHNVGPDDPTGALTMQNGEPFVDRDLLRPKFSDFVNAESACKVFIVRGHPASGKSHLWFYFNHLASAAPRDHRIYIDVNTMGPDPVGARDLIGKLALRMSLDMALLSTDEFAQEPRIAEKMCDWFVGQAQAFQQENQRWWIVIDGLNAPFLTAGAIDLVLKLAIAIARDEAPSCYLLLLGLTEPIPPSIGDLVIDENLAGLTKADISTYIDRFANALGRPLAPTALRAVTERMLAGQSFPYGHTEMRTIKSRLRQLRSIF